MPVIPETIPIDVVLESIIAREASISSSPSEFKFEPSPALTDYESSTFFMKLS